MVGQEVTWLVVYQACPLKDSSHLHKMDHILAPVLLDLAARMERTLVELEDHLDLSNSNLA